MTDAKPLLSEGDTRSLFWAAIGWVAIWTAVEYAAMALGFEPIWKEPSPLGSAIIWGWAGLRCIAFAMKRQSK